jgi:hypothetical protein
MIRESTIEKYARKRIADAGGWMIKFTSPGLRGVPDDIVLWPCSAVHFIEFKREGKKLRDEQWRVAGMFSDHGATVIMLDSIKSVDEYVAHRPV